MHPEYNPGSAVMGGVLYGGGSTVRHWPLNQGEAPSLCANEEWSSPKAQRSPALKQPAWGSRMASHRADGVNTNQISPSAANRAAAMPSGGSRLKNQFHAVNQEEQLLQPETTWRSQQQQQELAQQPWMQHTPAGETILESPTGVALEAGRDLSPGRLHLGPAMRPWPEDQARRPSPARSPPSPARSSASFAPNLLRTAAPAR